MIFFLKCQIQGLVSIGDPQVNLKGPISQTGKIGLDLSSSTQLVGFCLFGLVNASESLLSLSKCCSWLFLMVKIFLSAVSSMKALY